MVSTPSSVTRYLWIFMFTNPPATDIYTLSYTTLFRSRVVRDVHLAILAEQFSIGIEDDGCIVINTGAAFLEKRCDNHDVELACELTESSCRSSGNFLGQRKICVIFGLTKILRPEKFRQANDLRALFRCVANESNGAPEIIFGVRAASHLYERDTRCAI